MDFHIFLKSEGKEVERIRKKMTRDGGGGVRNFWGVEKFFFLGGGLRNFRGGGLRNFREGLGFFREGLGIFC